MELRITSQTQISRALAHARQQTDRLGVLLEQASSGKKLLTPSDNPLAALSVLSSKAQAEQMDAFLFNMQDANTTLSVAASRLQEVTGMIAETRRIGLEGAQSINSGEASENLADQVDALLERFLDLANTQQDGRYIFSGTATDTASFAVTGTNSDGTIQAISYQGADERANVAVSQNQTVDTRYLGSEVFQPKDRQTTTYIGPTGATAGTGTDNGIGQDTLLVSHTLTAYAGASGVAPGTGSVAGDSVLGPAGAHQLTIVDTSGIGTFGTVSLDNGGTVAWTNADTNLEVGGPNGGVVYVDTTAIAAGFSGTVNITSDGTLSTDGGATSVAINFSANQVVTDSVTGAVTNVDSTNIRVTGSDTVYYGGTFDLFQVLTGLRDDLRDTNLSAVQRAESIQRRLTELDRLGNNILKVLGEQGANLQNLEGLQGRVRDVQLETKQLISEREDVDVGEVVIQLQAHQNQLRLTLAAAARVFDQSLLDFIQ